MKLVSHERNGALSRSDYETPEWLFEKINDVFVFGLDAAANEENTKCPDWFGYSSDGFTDGLTGSWFDHVCTELSVWCNPPFSDWSEFMEKSVEEMQRGVTTVMLIPPRTDTKAWHKLVPYASEVILMESRISFLLDGVEQPNNGAASCLVIFRPLVVYNGPILTMWNPKNTDINT